VTMAQGPNVCGSTRVTWDFMIGSISVGAVPQQRSQRANPLCKLLGLALDVLWSVKALGQERRPLYS
jgi:hypothetical protein